CSCTPLVKSRTGRPGKHRPGPLEVTAAPNSVGAATRDIYVWRAAWLQPAAGLSFATRGRLTRDRLRQLSYGYSSILRGLVHAPARGRVLPRLQSLWRRRLRGPADPRGGRRLCVLDAQYAAAPAPSRRDPPGCPLSRAVHLDRLSAGARKLCHRGGGGRGPVSRIARPFRPPRGGVALRPDRVRRRFGFRGALRWFRPAGAGPRRRGRRGRVVGHDPLQKDPPQPRPRGPPARFRLVRSKPRGKAGAAGAARSGRR